MGKRKERVKNFTLIESVGGMGKSAFSGKNNFELLIINVGWLGKNLLLGFPESSYRVSIPGSVATCSTGLPRTYVSHVTRR